MNKLKSMLPPSLTSSSNAARRQSENLEPEIGFQLTIEASSPQNSNDPHAPKTVIPELNVHLMAARHLPSLFGFKIVQGYLIKVKLFPGSKRLDSTIQTNTWPKFNETFKFPLAPEIKPSLKHSSRRGSKAAVAEFTPEELLAGQFVVFTVYALLELPPTSFNRFSKTYRSLKDKSSNLMQNIFEEKSEKTTNNDDKENTKNKRKTQDNPRDSMPPLTISESRRNLGAVTCYLQPKLFKRNSRGVFASEELWMPIKDINTTVKKPNDNNNNLSNSTKGVVELVLEVREMGETIDPTNTDSSSSSSVANGGNNCINSNGSTTSVSTVTSTKEPKSWNNRMTSDFKKRMGISNVNTKTHHKLMLKVTTSRMRCSNKVKDELEATAGSVYVKTTVFDNGIYIDSWKSPNFYPSLATKWDVGKDVATLNIPLPSMEHLDRLMIRTTLATKTKMAKKLVLGTVVIGGTACGTTLSGTGAQQMAQLKDSPLNERVAVWHCYQ